MWSICSPRWRSSIRLWRSSCCTFPSWSQIRCYPWRVPYSLRSWPRPSRSCRWGRRCRQKPSCPGTISRFGWPQTRGEESSQSSHLKRLQLALGYSFYDVVQTDIISGFLPTLLSMNRTIFKCSQVLSVGNFPWLKMNAIVDSSGFSTLTWDSESLTNETFDGQC